MDNFKDLQQILFSLSAKERRATMHQLESKTRGGNNQLLELFNALEKTKSRDHKTDPLSRYPILSSKNLPTLKQRLQEVMLKEIGTRAAEENAYCQIQAELAAIGGLFQKNLHRQVFRVLKKVRRKAIRFDYKAIRLSALEWERKIIISQRTPESLKRLAALHRSQDYLWEIVRREMTLKNLLDEALMVFFSRNTSSKEAQNKLTSILRSTTLFPPEKIKEKRCRLLIFEIRGLCSFGLKEYEDAFIALQKALEEWEEDAAWIDEFPGEFLKDFNRFQNAVLSWGQGEDSLQRHSKKVEKLPLSRPEVRFRVRYYDLQVRFMMAMNFLKWEKTVAVVKESEAWLQKGNKLLTRQHKLNFYYNFAICYFLQDKFGTARSWLREIVDMPGQSERPDIRSAGKLLLLIVLLESKEYDYAEYFLQSTKAWFKRNAPEDEMAQSLFRLAGKILAAPDQNHQENFALFKSELEKGNPVQGKNEMLLWAESKIQEIPLKQVCEEQIPEMR